MTLVVQVVAMVVFLEALAASLLSLRPGNSSGGPHSPARRPCSPPHGPGSSAALIAPEAVLMVLVA
eukprot:6879813-Pyramimonas_sp.AAC.1